MVQLRLAEWDELPTLAQVAAAAFADDPIYLHFNPWRSVYPEEWRRSFLQTLQWRYAEPGSVVLVAEAQDENQEKILVGYLTATRRGTDAQPVSSWMQRPTEWGHQIATPAQKQEAQASRATLNRSSDPDAVARFYGEAKQILGGSLANTLETQTIAVLPSHQRGGVGKAFCKWFFDMSEAEGVRSVGDASEKGIGLYLKIGLKIRGTVVMDAKEARLEGTQAVVQLPRVQVPVIEWIPGEFRGV